MNLSAYSAFLAPLLVSSFLGGCSYLQSSKGEKLNPGAFRSFVSLHTQVVPVPVEIADSEGALTDGAVNLSKPADANPPTNLQNTSGIDPKVITSDSTDGKQATTESNPILQETSKKELDSSSEESASHPATARKKFKLNREHSRKTGQFMTHRYRIRRGDTLMKIAFAKYGDILKWRDIFEDNKKVLNQFDKIPVGGEILIAGGRFKVIQKNGIAYLIKLGDNLVKISNQVYGDKNRWKLIWKNNPELIKDPDRIYAGFRLYYKPINKLNKPIQVRSLSSEAPKENSLAR